MSEEYIPKFHKRFWRDLDKLEPKMAARVLDTIESKLLVDPYRYGTKLTDKRGPGQWRFRVGEYRIRYDIVGREVLIYRVRHRKEIYRI